MKTDDKMQFLDDTVRVLLALRTKPHFMSASDREAWFRELYHEAEILWEARTHSRDAHRPR